VRVKPETLAKYVSGYSDWDDESIFAACDRASRSVKLKLNIPSTSRISPRGLMRIGAAFQPDIYTIGPAKTAPAQFVDRVEPVILKSFGKASNPC
jgi:hypothetical protein